VKVKELCVKELCVKVLRVKCDGQDVGKTKETSRALFSSVCARAGCPTSPGFDSIMRSAGTLKPACRCVFAKSLNFSRKAKTSQAPSRQAEQPLPVPVPSTETKVMGMLGQLLDRFVPQEPHLTYETSQQAAMPTANW
jgi:hypothetical protein